MKIPEIRAQILATANTCRDPSLKSRLLTWERELHRRPYVRKASQHSKPTTQGLADRIRHHAVRHPHAPLQEIAVAFGVNIGRVSEALSGKRS